MSKHTISRKPANSKLRVSLRGIASLFLLTVLIILMPIVAAILLSVNAYLRLKRLSKNSITYDTNHVANILGVLFTNIKVYGKQCSQIGAVLKVK